MKRFSFFFFLFFFTENRIYISCKLSPTERNVQPCFLGKLKKNINLLSAAFANRRVVKGKMWYSMRNYRTMCAKKRPTSACTSMQSDTSLHCALHLWLSNEQGADPGGFLKVCVWGGGGGRGRLNHIYYCIYSTYSDRQCRPISDAII